MGNLSEFENIFITRKLQQVHRTINVKTKKAIAGTYRVNVDGYIVGECKAGNIITFELDGLSHKMISARKILGQIFISQEVIIPPGVESLDYYVFDPLTKAFNDNKETLELTAIEESVENNIYSYQNHLNKWRFECNIEKKIRDFAPEFKDSEGNITVAKRFNNLFSEEEKKYNLVRDVARKFRDKNYVYALNNYYDFQTIFQALDTVEASGFFQNEIDILNKHRNDLMDEYKKRKSIFTDYDDFGEALEKLRVKFMESFGGMHIPRELLNKYLNEFGIGHPLRKEQKWFEALKKTLWVDFDWEDIEVLKYLLVFDALLPEKSENERQSSEGLRLVYTSLFGYVHDRNENLVKRLTVDQIIVQTLAYQKGNMIDNINTQLAESLDVMCPLTEDGYNFAQDPSQFNILQKVFEYFQAPAQEKMVLEAMFRYNVPRTAEQEQRLAFLNRGDGAVVNIPDKGSDQKEGALLFDYRVCKWGMKEIKSYVDGFTFNSRKVDIPVVVEGQEHNLKVSTVKWDEQNVMQVLQKCLFENFGERYNVQLIEAGAVLESGTDMLPAVFINEKEDKFDSVISQGGTNVSGGQRQRLSIARAIALNPEIYIFDDSFSALDYKTDANLRKELSKNTKDSTILIVAQRISTVMKADQIIVLDNGSIVGIGKHEELMKNCDVYKEIALSQLSKEELAND